MTTSPNGGPAFPRAGMKLAGGVDPATNGMTLRDWFAGQALMGDIADHAGGVTNAGRAEWCYEMADAMLAEREKADY